MAREITQQELRDSSEEIVRGLDRGESFILSDAGVPVGALVPTHHRRFVSAEAVAATFRNAPPVDYGTLRTDLDRATRQDPTPRG